jgi:hypothetical protein
MKVLTHRPRYIEPAVVPEFGEGTSSAAEARQTAKIVQSAEELTVVPKVPTVGPAKDKDDKAKEPQVEKVLEILSPPAEAGLPKMQKAPAATPKRRMMASMLDVVMETTKALTLAPIKKTTEAAKGLAEDEAEPTLPIEAKAVTPKDKADQQTSDTRGRNLKVA